MPPQINIADLIRMLGPTPGTDVGGFREPAMVDPGMMADPGMMGDPVGAWEAGLSELEGSRVGPEGPGQGLERMPTDEMLLMPPEELEDIQFDAGPGLDPSPVGRDVGLGPGFDPELIGEERPRETAPIPARAPWDEDPLRARPDIPRARDPGMIDFGGPTPIAPPESMRPYARAPSAPGTPVDPGFTQADMEEIMEKHAIYGGPTPIAPRAERKPQLSPERQRELNQRKFLSRYMHPSERVMFGDPRAWPHLTQMELGRIKAGTQGEALKQSRAEQVAREAMAQRQFKWQMSQGTRQHSLALKQFESTEKARLEALGFSREESALKAKESADKLALLERQGQRTERGEERRHELTQEQIAERMATATQRFESERDARIAQDKKEMVLLQAQLAQAEAAGRRDEAKAISDDIARKETQELAREESESDRRTVKVTQLQTQAQALRTQAGVARADGRFDEYQELLRRAKEVDSQVNTLLMSPEEPPPPQREGGGELDVPAPDQPRPGETGTPAEGGALPTPLASASYFAKEGGKEPALGGELDWIAKHYGIHRWPASIINPGTWLEVGSTALGGDNSISDAHQLHYTVNYLAKLMAAGKINRGNVSLAASYMKSNYDPKVWSQIGGDNTIAPFNYPVKSSEEINDFMKSFSSGKMPDNPGQFVKMNFGGWYD